MNFIRLIIQQPALPKYRVPFFKELASRSGIQLTLHYSTNDPSLPNANPEGFSAIHTPMKKFKLFGKHSILWHSPQWKYTTHKHCDVLSLSWDLHYLSLIPSLLKARINQVPVVLWGHGYSKQESATRKFLRRTIARLASALVFYDFTTADDYIQSGWLSEKIYVAPNSLDQLEINHAKKEWLNDPEKLKRFRCENNIELGPNLIFIGRVYRDNRLDVLIQALPEVITLFPFTKLIIIGKGDIEANYLRNLAIKLQVENRIIWVGALYDEEKIAPWMLSANLCCYPSYMGLSLMHAFGYGLPVVTGDHVKKHGPEIYALKHEENGVLFPQNSSEALGNVICRLLQQPEQLAIMGISAGQTVEKIYNISKMADGFEAAVHYANQFYHK